MEPEASSQQPDNAMKTIYVVFGTTGEYSDRTEWVVAAYEDEVKARTHATLAKSWAVANGERWRDHHWSDEDSRMESPYDSAFSMDYTGTDYSVAAVELRTDVPSAEVAG